MTDHDPLLKPAAALLSRLRAVGIRPVPVLNERQIRVELLTENARLLTASLLAEVRHYERDLYALLGGCSARYTTDAGPYRCEAPVEVKAYWGDWFCRRCSTLMADYLEEHDCWPVVDVPDYPRVAA